MFLKPVPYLISKVLCNIYNRIESDHLAALMTNPGVQEIGRFGKKET